MGLHALKYVAAYMFGRGLSQNDQTWQKGLECENCGHSSLLCCFYSPTQEAHSSRASFMSEKR